jgi:hypothetical protein
VQPAENKAVVSAGLLSAPPASDYFYVAGTFRIQVFELCHLSQFISLMLF